MRINTNLSALNTQGRLNAAQTGMSKSLEKLSSGLRIGRASDDAAGLAISEKMRGQIKGLDRAGKNATEAISLIQTAEGALNESHSILQRMRELAGQAASDSATASDRNEMQKEVDALAKELTRITNTTQFNTKNLLGGSFADQRFQIGANTGQDISLSIGAMDAASLKLTANRGTTIVDGTGIKSSSLNSASTAATGRYTIDMKVNDAGFDKASGLGQSTKIDSFTKQIGTAENGFTIKSNDGYAAVEIKNVAGVGSSPQFNWDADSKTLTINVEEGVTSYQNITDAWSAWGGGASANPDGSVNAGGNAAHQALTLTRTGAATNDSLTKDGLTVSVNAGESGRVVFGDGTAGATAAVTWDSSTKTLTITGSNSGTTTAAALNALVDGLADGQEAEVEKIFSFSGTLAQSAVAANSVTLSENTASAATKTAVGQTSLNTNGLTISTKDGQTGKIAFALNTGTSSWDSATKTLTLAIDANQTVASALGDITGADNLAEINSIFNLSGTAVANSAATPAVTLGSTTDAGTFQVTSLASGDNNYSIRIDASGDVDSSPAVSVANGAITVKIDKSGASLGSIVDAINNDSTAKTLVKAEITSGNRDSLITGSANDYNSATGAVIGKELTGGSASTVDLTLKDESGSVIQSLTGQSTTSELTFNNGLKVTANEDAIETFAKGTNLGSVSIDVVAVDSKAAVSTGAGIISQDATVEKGILINTQKNASDALAVLDNAINNVSSARSNLGAIQNRLEHTISNLSVTAENMTAAESNIRDVDMAKEMSDFTKNQILSQAATAMLAQANQVPQGVLKLLG